MGKRLKPSIQDGVSNQYRQEMRDIATIRLDYSKLPSTTDVKGNTVPPNIKAANAIFEEAVREVRSYIRTEKGAAMLPGIKTGASGEIYRDIDLTSPNNDTYFANLKRELVNLLDARNDGNAPGKAISISRNQRKYNVLTAQISRELRDVLKEKTASVPLAEFSYDKDRNLTTLKIPEGAAWSGAKGAPVDAIASARSRIRAEQRDKIAQKSVEREQENRYFRNAGMDADVYRSTTDPKERRNLLNYVNKINRDLMASKNPDLAVNLARANAAKSASVGDALSFMVLQNPMMELTSQDAGRLTISAKTARKLAFDQAAYEEKYVNTDTGKQARFRALDIRQKNREYEREWINNRPNSVEAKAERTYQKKQRKENIKRTVARGKRTVRGAARLAQSTLHTLIRAILATAAAGVVVAAKTLSAVLSVGETVRQRNLNDLKLNLAPGMTKTWAAFAKNNGLEEDALVKALGGLYGSFGTVINFSKTNLDPWAMLLGQDITKLMSMFDGNGDTNTVDMMNGVMDTLLRNAQQRVVDVTKRGGQITEEQAMAEQIQQLSPLNQGLASMYSGFMEMFQKYQQDGHSFGTLEDYKQYLLSGAGAAGYDYGSFWEAFSMQGLWNAGEGAPPKPPDRVILDIASRQSLDSLKDALSSFSFLKEDVFSAISIKMTNLVNYVRSILDDFIRPFFPAFAQREDQRAAYVNEQSRQALERQMPVSQQQAMTVLKSAVPEDKIPNVISALQTFTKSGNIKPLMDTGLSGDQVNKLLAAKDFYAINNYIRGLAAQELLNELKGKGDKRAYMVTEAHFAEEGKWDAFISLVKLDRALGMYRNGDAGYVGAIDIANSIAEAEDRHERERQASLRKEESERSAAATALARLNEEVEPQMRTLRLNKAAVANTMIPASEKDVSKFPKKDTLFNRPNAAMSLDLMVGFSNANSQFSELLGNDRLYQFGYMGDDGYTSLGRESAINFIRSARAVANSSWLKAGLMPGAQQKEFFNEVRKRYLQVRKKDPELGGQLESILLGALYVMAAGKEADAATKQALTRSRIDIPDFFSDWLENPVENWFNTNSAQTVLSELMARQNRIAVASGVAVTPDMAALEFAVQKARIAEEITYAAGALLPGLLGGAGDGRTISLYAPKDNNGNLYLTVSVAGKPDEEYTIKNVIQSGQSMDRHFDIAEDFMGWSEAMPAGVP